MSGGVSFGEALRFWWRLGWISFGGPAGQIAIMHRELVERRRWISDGRFLHALNFCMVLPGPEAQQLATYLGWLMHGTRGGIAAGALFILPSLLILVVLSALYMTYASLPWVAAVLVGVKAAVAALVLAAAWRIGQRTLRSPLLWLVATAAFVALFFFGAPFPLILLCAALLGAAAIRWWPGALPAQPEAGHAATNAAMREAVVSDGSPVPAHARFSRRRLATQVAVFLLLGPGVAACLVGMLGIDSVPVQMAWFFTKAAFLTFGGAYAVLPYVFEGAVQQHQWLSAAQMMDGLALGESTPGPLIMVVTYIGFVGGWNEALRAAGGSALSALGPAGLALLCAVVVTFFTFLPSFLFILAGGPLVEATHGEVRLTGPLSCVTAAVVGVILNLALHFGWRVFWPGGTTADVFKGGPDMAAAGIALLAFWALVATRVNVVVVIAACAGAGLVLKLAGAR